MLEWLKLPDLDGHAGHCRWNVALEIWRMMTCQEQNAPIAVKLLIITVVQIEATQAAATFIYYRLSRRSCDVKTESSCSISIPIMAYQIPRSAFRYMNDATFRSGPSVSPAYGTSRSKDPRMPHSVYSPAHGAEYCRAGQSSYGMAYERRSPYENDIYPSGLSQRHIGGDIISR